MNKEIFESGADRVISNNSINNTDYYVLNFKELHPELTTNRQILGKFVELYPETHLKLNELSAALGKDVCDERVRVLLNDLGERGLCYITFKKHKTHLKNEKKEIKNEIKNEIINKKKIFRYQIRDLFLEGQSGPQIEGLLPVPEGTYKNVRSATAQLRLNGELPRQRNRRTKKEIILADEKVKKLYVDGLSYKEIEEVTGLNEFVVTNTLYRLDKNGEIDRRNKHSKKQ